MPNKSLENDPFDSLRSLRASQLRRYANNNNRFRISIVKGMNMKDINISLMEINDLQESARVLSVAMLDNPLHYAVFQGKGENERLEIEKMFNDLFLQLPGIVFLAKEKNNIIGVMRMKSCRGSKAKEDPKKSEKKSDIGWRKSVWHAEWARRDPLEQHWHLGPIGVLPSHQGSGIGSLLMERFCREVDACSARAYLETEGDKNRGFYKKFGFDIISKSIIFNVENLYMERVSQTRFDRMHNKAKAADTKSRAAD